MKFEEEKQENTINEFSKTQNVKNEEIEVTLNPLDMIPLKYKGMHSEVLGEMWTEKIYLDEAKTLYEKMIRKDAIEALRNKEIEEGEGIFTETEEEIINIIPKEWRGLPIEFLEEVWQAETGNEVQRKYFEQKKQLVLDFLKNKENAENKKYKHIQDRHNESQKINELKTELMGISKSHENEVLTPDFTSRTLENDKLHKIGNFNTDGREVLFFNNDHTQDAFAVHENTYVVSDGASSYGKAGLMSGLLAQTVSEKVSHGSLDGVFQEDALRELISVIQKDPHYVDKNPVEGSAVKEKDSGLATLLAITVDHQNKKIDFKSIGDSPLFIVDRNDAGEILSFSIVNEKAVITNENYTDKDTLEELKNPQTHLIGSREDGRISTSSVSSLQSGSIDYKKGRSVVLASDSLIKLMINSPEGLEVMKQNARHEVSKPLFQKQKEEMIRDFPELWVTNPKTGENMLDPLFFTKIEKDKLALLLSEFKSRFMYSADDITAIAIDMDREFSK